MDDSGVNSDWRCWRFGDVEVDDGLRQLRVGGQAVELQPRVWQLLTRLLQRPGEVCGKDELLATLWPDQIVTEAVLTNCVAKLRRALGDRGHRVILTAHGQGYRIAVPVEIGRHPVPQAGFCLAVGDSPAGRPEWRVVQALPATTGTQAWLIEHRSNGERRVHKRALDGQGSASLLREWQAWQRLHAAYGSNTPAVSVLDWHASPEHTRLETEWGPLPDFSARLFGVVERSSLAQRLTWVVMTAEAIEAAHAAGVLHEDLRSSCIHFFDDPDGRATVRLADWGQAQWPAEGRGSLSRRRRAMDRPGDIHALGNLLYQTLVGTPDAVPRPEWERDVAEPELLQLIADAIAAPLGHVPLSAGRFAGRLRDWLRLRPA